MKLTCVFCGMPIAYGIGHRSLAECTHCIAKTFVPGDEMPLFFKDWVGCRKAMIKQLERDKLNISEYPTIAKEVMDEHVYNINRFHHSSMRLADAPFIRAMQEGRMFYAN